MEGSQDDFEGGLVVLRHDPNRNAAPIVDNSYQIVFVNQDLDPVTISAQSFINRVVDNFSDQVMQTFSAGILKTGNLPSGEKSKKRKKDKNAKLK